MSRVLAIGNKKYSSWSLRPWLLMRELNIDFVEKRLALYEAGFKDEAKQVSPSGKLPSLVEPDGLKVWDSLAIIEYMHEKFPDRNVWPSDMKARAVARSACAEMHSGFTALRSNMGMCAGVKLKGLGWNKEVQKDIDRICQLWSELRSTYGQDGPFLFGKFTAVDAFFAPVALRFDTYEPTLPASAHEYVKALLGLKWLQLWVKEANEEKEFIEKV
jgi:glutathione S-transferase